MWPQIKSQHPSLAQSWVDQQHFTVSLVYFICCVSFKGLQNVFVLQNVLYDLNPVEWIHLLATASSETKTWVLAQQLHLWVIDQNK